MSLEFLCQLGSRGGIGDEFFEFHAPKIAKRYPVVNSVSLRDTNSRTLDHPDMPKSAAEIRRENFAAEVEKAGGAQKFADLHEGNVDYVRQMLNGKGVKGGRNIGDRSARRIEGYLKKPKNWLDQDHSDPRSPALVTNQAENDVDALRFFAAALTAAMAAIRPGEGAAVAATLRKKAPKKFVENGLLKELLQVLDKGSKKAKIRPPAPFA